MALTVSRRSVLKTTIGAALGGTGILSTAAQAQTQPVGGPIDRFFRDDGFGEPWRKQQAVVLIHGALESGVVWFAWVPTLAKEYRVLRPDLPGCGLSTVPVDFDWSFPGLAGYIASVLDKAGVESAHIVARKRAARSRCSSLPIFPQGRGLSASSADRLRSSRLRIHRPFRRKTDSGRPPLRR